MMRNCTLLPARCLSKCVLFVIKFENMTWASWRNLAYPNSCSLHPPLSQSHHRHTQNYFKPNEALQKRVTRAKPRIICLCILLSVGKRSPRCVY